MAGCTAFLENATLRSSRRPSKKGPSSWKFGPQRGAAGFLSPEVDLVDPSRVGEVLSWIRVVEEEIGALARRHHPGIDPHDFEPEKIPG